MGKTTPESKVKDRVKEIFKAHGVWYHMTFTHGVGSNGAPDFIASLPPTGHFLGVECKATEKQKPTPLQLFQAAAIKKTKGSWMVVDSSNIEQFEHYISVVVTLP